MNRTEIQDNFLGLDASMKGPAVASTVFHVAVVVLATLGLPFVAKNPVVISNPISIEIVDIDEITQSNRISKPVPKPKKINAPKPPKQRKPAPPQMSAEIPPELALPKPPEIKQVKMDIKKSEPPVKKPEVTKHTEPKKKNDFTSLLKNLTPDINEKPEEQVLENAAQITHLSERLTMSEIDALRRQLARCWNVMAGAKNARDLVVEVRVTITPDRIVEQATILGQGRYNRDSHYRAAADAALRALRNPRCSPLALPPDKYDQWKTTVIRFDPKEML